METSSSATSATIGANEQQLNFYRYKMTQHEQERIEWQEAAEQARHNTDKVHELENEVEMTKQQIAELQKALSDSHLAIYDEKSYQMQLAREHSLLQTQESSDQKRKNELQSLSTEIAETAADEKDPRSGKYTNYRDCRPSAQAKRAQKKVQQNKTQLAPKEAQQNVLTNKFITEKLTQGPASSSTTQGRKGAAPATKASSARGSAAPASSRSGISSATGKSAGGVVKTIVLPHEDINRLGTEAQELMQFMQTQKVLFQDTVTGYQKDRSVRTQEFDLKGQDFQRTIADLEQRLSDRKGENYQISNDYFNYKHAIVGAKSTLEDQIALAKVENEALKQQVDQICESERADGKYSEQLYAQKTNQFAARFRKASRQNEQELNIIKVQYAEVQDQYLSELQALEGQLKANTRRGKQVEGKRATEGQAFSNDITVLRKRVQDYERHIKRLKIYVDREDTEALVDELQAPQLSEMDLGKLADEIHNIEEEVVDARRVKFRAI